MYTAKKYQDNINLGYLRLIRDISSLLGTITICITSTIAGFGYSTTRINMNATYLSSSLSIMIYALGIITLAGVIKEVTSIQKFTRSLMYYDRFEAETLQRIAELERKIPSNKQ